MQGGRHSARPACTAAALRKATRRITQFYDTALAPAGLTVTQYSLLTELARRGKRVPTVTELADAMVMDRSGLGHTLGPLERDGLITLAVHSKDARARNVVLTVKGKARQRQAAIFWARAQKEFSDIFGTRQAAQLHSALLAIAHDERLSSS
jgi:DNA-binding MarR family transcriptional regulator